MTHRLPASGQVLRQDERHEPAKSSRGVGSIPSSSRMAASVGFTLLLPLPRFPFCAILAVRVTLRAPLPPATAGLPTPSLYWVFFARRVRGGNTGATSDSEECTEGRLVSKSSAYVLSSSSVSCIITEDEDAPRRREVVVEREAIRVDGAR